MRSFLRSILCCALVLSLFSVFASAQEMTPDEKKAEKEFYESLNNEVDRLTNLLDLDDVQIFYVDSILTHDYKAMQDELKDLQSKKVSNLDIFYDVRYKWQDQIYYSMEKILDEAQWAKYLKNGAARDKKNRDKNRAKSQK